MTVGARDPTITVSFDEERADVGSVPLGSFRATQPPLSDVTIVFASDGRKSVLDLWIIIWQIELINVRIHLVGPKVTIRRICRHDNLLVLLNELVSQLNGKAEVEVKDACLAHVLHLGTRLTDLCLLIPCGLVLILRARLPPEDSEGPLARLALSGELRARHTNIRIVAKACLT